MVAMNLPGRQVSTIANQIGSGGGANLTRYDNYGLASRFMVAVDGLVLGNWSSCTGLGVSFNPEELKVGGRYDQPHLLPGRVSWTEVTLERAIDKNGHNEVDKLLRSIVSDWIDWDGSQQSPSYQGHHVVIRLYGPLGTKEVASWTLHNCVVKSWSGPSLTGTKNEVATERLVFVHEGFWETAPQPAKVTLTMQGSTPVEFDFFPEKWTLGQGVHLKDSGATQVTTESQVTKIDDRVLTLGKLRVNGTSTIKDHINTLFGWVTPTTSGAAGKGGDSTGPAPEIPTLTLNIGQSVRNLDVNLRKVTVDIVRFNQHGDPISAEFTLDLVQQNRAQKTMNPTSGGRWANRTHTVSAGECLQRIAQSTYRNPGSWRMIAEENAVDDPLRVRNGSVLLLPRTTD